MAVVTMATVRRDFVSVTLVGMEQIAPKKRRVAW